MFGRLFVAQGDDLLHDAVHGAGGGALVVYGLPFDAEVIEHASGVGHAERLPLDDGIDLRALYAPYIYTEAEILAIWNVLDRLESRGGFPVRQFVIPAMVKLLYCCGLRPAEARRLRVGDVNLDKGRLNIMESKQRRSRIVMMADDVAIMLSGYNAIVSTVMPEREPFFPNSEGGIYGKRGLEKTFRQTLMKAGIDGIGRRSPRLYDFRHTFATHRLYYWMREGKNLNIMLPYLSALQRFHGLGLRG